MQLTIFFLFQYKLMFLALVISFVLFFFLAERSSHSCISRSSSFSCCNYERVVDVLSKVFCSNSSSYYSSASWASTPRSTRISLSWYVTWFVVFLFPLHPLRITSWYTVLPLSFYCKMSYLQKKSTWPHDNCVLFFFFFNQQSMWNKLPCSSYYVWKLVKKMQSISILLLK